MKDQNNNPSELDQLMAAVLKVAEEQMRSQGITLITYMMATPQGTRVEIGDASSDFQTLATIFRLSSVAQAARVGVVSYQVRIRPDQNGPAEEAILVCGEALGGIYRNWAYPILRNPQGCFAALGAKEVLSPIPPATVFGRLLPTGTPTAQERQAAAKALAARITPIDQVDPKRKR